MFTLPPRPPKDYVLAEVTKNLQSSLQFTPDALPRVTQPSLARFCSPVEYGDDEVPEKTAPERYEPSIMKRMVDHERAEWVVDPVKDGFLVLDVFKRFGTRERAADLDPRYKHKERVFNRSYKYELDCAEAARVEKLRAKCERELAEFEGAYERLVSKQKEKEKPTIRVLPCKEGPPFWWKGDVPGKEKEKADSDRALEEADPEAVNNAGTYARWQEEPDLAGCIQDDPCKRKYDLLSVGRDFRTEACNFYYKNYPPPAITFRPKKFA